MWLRQTYLNIGFHTAAPGTLLYRMHKNIASFYAKTMRKRLMAAGTPHDVLTGKKTSRYVATKASGPFRIFFPSANNQLAKDEYEHCCALVDYYAEESRQIIPYCQERGRDSALYDRGNVWKSGNFVDNMGRMLLSKKYNNINRLRLIGWHFPGYRMFDLAGAADAAANEWFENFYNRGVLELPDDIDTIIKEAINPWDRIELLMPRLSRILSNVDHKYLHGQPLRFGELAGEFRGFAVNGDTVRYWSTVAVLYRARIFAHLERKIAERGFCRVMEIGPGYGGLAYQLKKTFGNKLQFIGVDLVESLTYSSCYLTTLMNEKTLYYKDEKDISNEYGLVFVPTFRSPEFFNAVKDVDLCINTISMNEMAPAQVDYYGQMISKTLATDGVFFECNWMAAVAGPERIEVKGYLALHFNDRLSVEKTESAGDGNLDLWSNNLPKDIEEACIRQYDKENIIHYQRATRD